jgi:probable phosphoglycerate mutase
MIIGIEALNAMSAETPLMLPIEEFYFLRHGETAGNFGKIVQIPEIPLNDRGRQQATMAAELLGKAQFSHMVASTFERAAETARIVARATGHRIDPSDGVVERRFGKLMGTSSIGLNWDCAPEGGETLRQFVDRARAGCTAALVAGGDAPPLIVSHGGVLRVLAASVGIPLDDMHVVNATPLRFTRTNGKWRCGLL